MEKTWHFVKKKKEIMKNTVETDQWMTCGMDILWPLKIHSYSIKAAARSKDCWVWEDVANRRAVLECQSSAMWLEAPSLSVSLDARQAYVWSNNVEIDGYFMKCRHLNRDLRTKMVGYWRRRDPAEIVNLNAELLNLLWHIYDRM